MAFSARSALQNSGGFAPTSGGFHLVIMHILHQYYRLTFCFKTNTIT